MKNGGYVFSKLIHRIDVFKLLTGNRYAYMFFLVHQDLSLASGDLGFYEVNGGAEPFGAYGFNFKTVATINTSGERGKGCVGWLSVLTGDSLNKPPD